MDILRTRKSRLAVFFVVIFTANTLAYWWLRDWSTGGLLLGLGMTAGIIAAMGAFYGLVTWICNGDQP